MEAAKVAVRLDAERPAYRVVVRRANDLPREDARETGAQWLLARGAAATVFAVRRAHRRWRVELRLGDTLVMSRQVEHRTAGDVLAELWRRGLATGVHLDELP
jgi:hypothetical protein